MSSVPPPAPPPPPWSAPTSAVPPPATPSTWGSLPGSESQPQPVAPKRSGLALAAMICGLAGLLMCFLVVPSIVAVVLGFVAAGQIKRSGGALTGLGAARVGWITGLVGLALAATFFTAAALGAFDDDGEVAVFALDPGDCVDVDLQMVEVDVDTLPRIDCTDPHNGEVIATGELNADGDEPYPDDEALFGELDAICRSALTRFGDDRFTWLPVGPDERAWNVADGPYVCIAVLPSGTTTDGLAD